MNKILKWIEIEYEWWDFNGHKIYFMKYHNHPIWYQIADKHKLLIDLRAGRIPCFYAGIEIYRIYLPWGPLDIS